MIKRILCVVSDSDEEYFQKFHPTLKLLCKRHNLRLDRVKPEQLSETKIEDEIMVMLFCSPESLFYEDGFTEWVKHKQVRRVIIVKLRKSEITESMLSTWVPIYGLGWYSDCASKSSESDDYLYRMSQALSKILNT